MATTTNYGWTTPDDTALVKDGAAAIRTLGSSIDTSLNTALGTKKAGMVLLNTTSFSGVASQSVNDVFSTTYDNYRIICRLTNTNGEGLIFRYRVAGADNSTSNYFYQNLGAFGTSVSASRASSQTSYFVASAGTTEGGFDLTLFSPFLSQTKTGISHSSYTAPTSGITSNHYVLGFNASTSFTGFTILTGSGTNTGTISVYGMNK